MNRHVSRAFHLLLLVVLLGTCGSSMYFVRNEPEATPTATFAPRTPIPSLPPTSDMAPETGWSLLQPGLERRVIQIYNDQNQPVEALHIWRLDQNYFRMDVAYDETPKSMETWQRETNALITNGASFRVRTLRCSF